MSSILAPMLNTWLFCVLFVLTFGCKSENQASPDAHALDNPQARPSWSRNWQRDILSYDLSINLENKTASAKIQIQGDSSTGLSLDVGSLTIDDVKDEFGSLQYLDLGKELQIGIPSGGQSREFIIEYHFSNHEDFNGWNQEQGLSFIWPAFCGNLFPCHSDPADGATFIIDVQGTEGLAIYPRRIEKDAPSYMPAIAIGNYQKNVLGTTTAGTEVSVWFTPGQEDNAAQGTSHLLDVFDFFETTYGEYAFGSEVGTVSVHWGRGSFGGMEHHPFWHIAKGSLKSEETNAHEAAHGWFGNGVRIACWEDFVLSEGVVTYMAARALSEHDVDLWPRYDCLLKRVCSGAENTQVLLDSCGVINLIEHDLWSAAPYQKGAQFLREVAALLGQDLVDQSLASFYQAHVGKAARMQDLIELLKNQGKANEIEVLSQEWLLNESCPDRVEEMCPVP